MRTFRTDWKFPVSSLVASLLLASPAWGDETPTFERDIRPILKTYCFSCHGEQGQKKSGLDLRLRRFLVSGGDFGPAIVPGKPQESYLLERVRKGEMPPGKSAKKLSPEQITLIERWIAAGAATVRPEPETLGPGLYITEEDRQLWSFQPIRRPPVPTPPPPPQDREGWDRVRTPIDAFVLRRLNEQGFSFSPDADRRTLVRRAYFDLIGLPPTPAEIEQANDDVSPDWYEKLLDRLLASPHHGERWGRHWLDVAGYADSEGQTADDPVREHAFRYRDYVIRSLNADKPFDQFIREQLAGDEMVPPPHRNLAPEQAEKLIATGFLSMAPNPLTANNGADPRMSHDVWISESIKVVSTALLGLSVGCAQCHDHRFDPISQEDYYRFRAILEPAYDLRHWRVPRQRLISLYHDEDRARFASVEAEAKQVDARKNKLEQEVYQKVLEQELAKVPEEVRESVRQAHLAPRPGRTPEQRMLLLKYPRLNFTVSNLPVYDREGAAAVGKLADEAARIRAQLPPEGFIQAQAEQPGAPPRTFLLTRGDYLQPKQVLPPAELSILQGRDPPALPVDDPALPTTGRRLAYARHLTDGNHPLVARTIVNRVWMHHFGRGLSDTPADLGVLGDRPAHPELLDWLAREFMDGGWSLKRLHRSIMSSTVYRQGLLRNEKLASIDPENRLLGGFKPRRLESEIIRDAILAVSGKTNVKQFGPAVPVMRDLAGEIVLGIERTNAGIPLPSIPLNGEEFRRSVYVQVRRSRPLTFMQNFDAPLMEPNCEQRRSSTVATQALMLMNNNFIIQQSRFFAERVHQSAGSDPNAQIVHAWRLALARNPNAEERADALAFLQARTAHFRAHPLPPVPAAPERPARPNAGGLAGQVGPAALEAKSPELEALAVFCQVLLSCNEFLYVD
jgi:hypothetical protein